MATKGFFTFHDLYLGRGKEYLYKNIYESSLTRADRLWHSSHTDNEDIFPSMIDAQEPITINNTTELSFTSTVDQHLVPKVVQVDTFIYLYWVLIGLATFFTLLLIAVLTYYCCNQCKRKKKQREQKKEGFLPNFYRYRTNHRDTPTYNLYQSTAPLFFSSPLAPYQTKLSDSADDSQLLRKGLDAVGTPQSSRTEINQKDSINSFTSSASDLLTEIKDRLNRQSSRRSINFEKNTETQGAKIALSDESKTSS